MMCPIELMIDEDTKVMDDEGLLNSVGTGAGGPRVDGGNKAADKMFSSTRGSKRYELSFIHVAFKPIPP